MDKELQNLADEEILKYANVEVEKRLKREIVYLYRLLRFLRKNCPWDRVQNHESLEKHMIEEAYEVCDAIEKSDKINLKEELGDVLLQLVFHSILAEETDDFTQKQLTKPLKIGIILSAKNIHTILVQMR